MGDRVRKDGSRFGKRLIRPGGRVRWLGHWYRLVDGDVPRVEYEKLTLEQCTEIGAPKPRYDGSMDGRVGLFYNYSLLNLNLKNYVYLHNVDDEWPGPECVAGVFVWETFRREDLPPVVD